MQAANDNQPRRVTAYPPRAMKADAAASYLAMSRSKFYELVEEQRLPRPKIIDGLRLWDRLALDHAFDEFDEAGEVRPNTFDAALRGVA